MCRHANGLLFLSVVTFRAGAVHTQWGHSCPWCVFSSGKRKMGNKVSSDSQSGGWWLSEEHGEEILHVPQRLLSKTIPELYQFGFLQWSPPFKGFSVAGLPNTGRNCVQEPGSLNPTHKPFWWSGTRKLGLQGGHTPLQLPRVTGHSNRASLCWWVLPTSTQAGKWFLHSSFSFKTLSCRKMDSTNSSFVQLSMASMWRKVFFWPRVSEVSRSGHLTPFFGEAEH